MGGSGGGGRGSVGDGLSLSRVKSKALMKMRRCMPRSSAKSACRDIKASTVILTLRWRAGGYIRVYAALAGRCGRCWLSSGLHMRTLGRHLRIETRDILPTVQLGAWRQDGSCTSGHAEHECVLHILSARERDGHARDKAIACSHSAHRLHL